MSLFYNNFYANYPAQSTNTPSLLKVDADALRGMIRNNSERIDKELEQLKRLSQQFKEKR
ncbi:hypothetical protein [Petroclostridium sp. X23]|uniref:hypothetical protein n=1 Tax=Petroclostridium sp. X23 TaxID=3045146 RepID=UPI0024ADB4E1|nr:hypothetical protein [Petroclostridium sp. X23]WHH60205.1 hypothetical protein QKW49_05590 [Petroclostridium sp. X23]